MFAAQDEAHSTESVRVLTVLAAVALVAYWRIAIKLMIMIVATILLAILGFGGFVVFEAIHG
jgi:hypothetical protein